MSKAALKEILDGEPKGAMQAAMDGIRAVAPGLSLSNILSDIGSEIQQIGAHGAHEMAAHPGTFNPAYSRGTYSR